ncbi:Bifunctional nuclease 2-like protein [Drosera capensis]
MAAAASLHVAFTTRSTSRNRTGPTPISITMANSLWRRIGVVDLRSGAQCSGSGGVGSGGDARVRFRSVESRFGEEPSPRRLRCGAGSVGDNGGRGDGDVESGGDEDEYVDCSVMEADEVMNESESFLIKMIDGRYLRCVYDQWKGRYPPDYVSHPAIVLKMEDDCGLLLPIIVSEMASLLLMAALHNVEMSRPSVYHVMKVLIETVGYEVKLVRITKRVQDNYCAELCIAKVGDKTELLRFPIRPSDAINIAVTCKAPIQVNKRLVYADGLKLVEPEELLPGVHLFDGFLCSELDRPEDGPCLISEEFILVHNMMIAAVEERYCDAARWKKLLHQFRARRPKLRDRYVLSRPIRRWTNL